MGNLGHRLGERIRQLRRSKGLSQAQLAEKLGEGCAPETIGRYERGSMFPSWRTLERLAAALSLDIDALLGPIFVPPRQGVQRVVDLLARVSDERLDRIVQILSLVVEDEEHRNPS